MAELLRCVCCGMPRARRTGHDRCGRCRHGDCGRCRPPGFRAARTRRFCACGEPCWHARKRGAEPRCRECAMLQTWQAKAEGPHELDPPRIHFYHARAMAGLPLFDGPRSDRS